MEYTPEQQQDAVERASKFQEEHKEFYKSLKEKYQCQFTQSVETVPSPAGVFGLTVVERVMDTKYVATPSPFVPSNELTDPAA